MNPMKNTMQQRLMSANAAQGQNTAQNDPEFEALVDEISVLVQQGKLPATEAAAALASLSIENE